MRTTVDLDKPLLVAAKRQAAASHTSLSRLVQDALRLYLELPERAAEESFELLTCGTPGGHYPTPREVASALAAEESALLIRDADA
jgi:hypothetical protein